MLSLDRSSWR
jgi:hypothetical protein